LLNKFNIKSEYAKNIVTLVTGTAIAQAVPIAITPILTRFYTPVEFGMFGMYIGIVSLLVIISTLKYDVAIIQPKNDFDAEQVFKLSFIISSVFSILILVLIYFNIDYLSQISEESNFKYFIYLIPYTVFIMSANSGLNFIMNRRKYYKQMSINKVIQGLSIAFISLLFGFLDYTAFGLLIGFIIGHTIVFLNLIYRYWFTIEKMNCTAMLNVAKVYKDYPIYALPSGLSNTSASQMPVILLTKVFNSSISGYYYLVEKVLSAPISLLGSSVSSVFRQKAQEDKHTLGNYNSIFKKTLSKLVMIGLPIFLVLGIFGVEIFSFIFGKNWSEAGVYAQILSPLFFFKFTISPLMSSFYISNKLSTDMIGQIIYAIMILGAIYLGYIFNSIILSISLISFAGSLFYLSFLYLIYGYSKEEV
jgi:O-antigen/teichoic acid export membrane protein